MLLKNFRKLSAMGVGVGQIFGDTRGRFKDGTIIMTSRITDEQYDLDGKLCKIYTVYSEYDVELEPDNF